MPRRSGPSRAGKSRQGCRSDQAPRRWQPGERGASRTHVVCAGAAAGDHCLAAAALGHADAPGALRRNRPDPIPVMALGRLAIHKDHRQAGLGTGLLRDALGRTLQAAGIAGVAELLVHALSDDTRRFYRSRGFIESPVRPVTLCLVLKAVRKALRGGM